MYIHGIPGENGVTTQLSMQPYSTSADEVSDYVRRREFIDTGALECLNICLLNRSYDQVTIALTSTQYS